MKMTEPAAVSTSGTLKKRCDTPTAIARFVNQKRLDDIMAIQKLSQGGRPSKGPRHTFVVKLDIARAEKLRAIMELLDTNAVEYLTPLVAEHIDSINLDELRNQEELPIQRSA